MTAHIKSSRQDGRGGRVAPDRLTIRLGSLAEPLAAECARLGETPAAITRRALAALLSVAAPDMPVGNPTIAGHSAKASRKRWRAVRRLARQGKALTLPDDATLPPEGD